MIRDGARALRVARAIEAGVLSINSNISVRVATPFGGFKQSGYGRELADGYENVVAFFHQSHRETVEILRTLDDADLKKECTTPAGTKLQVWKWLRAMVEHEIHHRGQMYLMLNLLDVERPRLYGLTAEEVLEKSRL